MAKPAKRSDCLPMEERSQTFRLPMSKSARLFSRGMAEVYRVLSAAVCNGRRNEARDVHLSVHSLIASFVGWSSCGPRMVIDIEFAGPSIVGFSCWVG
jgi:hypothetical protein